MVSRHTQPVRDRILRAALECFMSEGVEGTTIAMVRKRAGVSVGAVYHHFRDKDALAEAVFVDGLRQYHDAFLAALEAGADARTSLESAVAEHVRWCIEHPDVARFVFAGRRWADAEGTPALAGEGGRFFARIHAWAAPHVHYGAIRDLPTDVLVASITGPSLVWVRLWLGGRARTDAAGAATQLAEATWRAVAAATP